MTVKHLCQEMRVNGDSGKKTCNGQSDALVTLPPGPTGFRFRLGGDCTSWASASCSTSQAHWSHRKRVTYWCQPFWTSQRRRCTSTMPAFWYVCQKRLPEATRRLESITHLKTCALLVSSIAATASWQMRRGSVGSTTFNIGYYPDNTGFLPGRSILTNLLELEIASMTTSLEGGDGSSILLDFSAAFLSVSQEFLKGCLQHIGLPENALQMLDSLESASFCRIAFGGIQADGFPLASGVRQGCPLPPLLYATVAELLLAYLGHNCPAVTPKAYADDTALVCKHI